mgnify:CR=1 FL=1
MSKNLVIKSLIAGLFSCLTIGILTLLTYKTDYGMFLIASFGSSMVLLYGYPESPFAQPKNIFFGHLITSVVGVIFLNFLPLPIYMLIPIAVGVGVASMIILNITHPPAGGNPIIVIIGSVSLDYLINPIIIGSIIILIFGIILNRLILKKKYPL